MVHYYCDIVIILRVSWNLKTLTKKFQRDIFVHNFIDTCTAWNIYSFLLYLIANKVCLQIYLAGVSLSSDFIAGFCGETEEDHRQTVDLMRQVQYNFAFCFPYSLRQVGGSTCNGNVVASIEVLTKRQLFTQSLVAAHNTAWHDTGPIPSLDFSDSIFFPPFGIQMNTRIHLCKNGKVHCTQVYNHVCLKIFTLLMPKLSCVKAVKLGLPVSSLHMYMYYLYLAE